MSAATMQRSKSSAARLQPDAADQQISRLPAVQQRRKRAASFSASSSPFGDAGGGSVQKVIQESRAVMRSSSKHLSVDRRISAMRGYQQNLPTHQQIAQPRRLSRLNQKPAPKAAAAGVYAEGDRVVLAPSLVTPAHGWGGMTPLGVRTSVGVVVNCLHKEVFVEFPDRRLWLNCGEIQRTVKRRPPANNTPPDSPDGVDSSAVFEQLESPPRETRAAAAIDSRRRPAAATGDGGDRLRGGGSDRQAAARPAAKKQQAVRAETKRSSLKAQQAKRHKSPRSSPRALAAAAAPELAPVTNAEHGMSMNAAAPPSTPHQTAAAEANLLAELQQWRAVDQTQRELADQAASAVVQFMHLRVTEAALQQAACMTLYKLAFDDASRLEIADAGGVERIVHAMDAHPDSMTLQEEGCAALGNLGYGQSQNRARIVACGGASVVARAASNHRSSESVCWKACAALWTLAGGEPDEGCHAAIGEAGGVAIVLQALRVHRKSEAVQEKGCGALANLALSDVQQAAILEGGGLSLAVSALRAFPRSPAVQEKGRAALWNLRATASPERKFRRTPPDTQPTQPSSSPLLKRPQAWVGMNAGTDMVCVLRSVMRETAAKDSNKMGFVEVGDTVQIAEEITASDGSVRVRLTATEAAKGTTFAGGRSGWITNGGPSKTPALIDGSAFLNAGGDLDGDGRVSREEFVVWHLFHMGEKPCVDAFHVFFSADTDGDGDVDPEEFASIQPSLARIAAEKAAAKYPRQFTIFSTLDADGSGSLDPEELSRYLEEMDVSVAGELVRCLDRNADGEVDFLEFCHAWERFDVPMPEAMVKSEPEPEPEPEPAPELATPTPDDMDELRACWDEIAAGVAAGSVNAALSHADLRKVFSQLGRHLSDSEFDSAFAAMDADGSGEIEFAEFVAFYRSQSAEERQKTRGLKVKAELFRRLKNGELSAEQECVLRERFGDE